MKTVICLLLAVIALKIIIPPSEYDKAEYDYRKAKREFLNKKEELSKIGLRSR